MERLELPDTLNQVEDWGFAQMKNLRELVLPFKEICFGKKVFLSSKVRWMEGMPMELALAGGCPRGARFPDEVQP